MHYPLKHYVTCTKFSTSHQVSLATITKIAEPRFYHEAVKSENWRQAMIAAIQAFEKNDAWSIVSLSSGKKSISCKWVYRVKYKSDSTVE